MTAKLLNVTPTEYHRMDGRWLSSSVAKTIVAKSPLHAVTQLESDRKSTPSQDRGSVGHRLVLGKGADFDIVDADDWRTNKAKERRDEIRAAGRIPILRHVYDDADRSAGEVVGRLMSLGIVLNGQSEQAIEWEEPSPLGAVKCKGMFDHVWINDGRILDLKFTESAHPHDIERTAERFGYAIQAHAYSRALGLLKPELMGRVEFLFAFCEFDPPYAVTLCRLDGAFRELGERRWQRAVTAWSKALATDTWPSYVDGPHYLNPPAWALTLEDIQ